MAILVLGIAAYTSPPADSVVLPDANSGPTHKTEAAASAKAAVTIAIGTDLHYLSPDLTDNGEYFQKMMDNSDAKAMLYSEEIIDGFLSEIIRHNPQTLILSGDITFNGEKLSHEGLAKKLEAVEEAGTQVLVMPGNHDLYVETAASFSGDSYILVDSVTAEEFEEIYHAFGFDEALSRDPASLSYTYEVAPGVWALMVDVNTKSSPGAITEATLDWVGTQLEASKDEGAKVLAVSHQNLLSHNYLFSEGYIIGGRNALYDLYIEYGVLCNLSGHMHIQHIAEMEGVIDIATSALSVAPCQYGVLDLYSGGMDYHTERTDFPHAEDAIRMMKERSHRSVLKKIPDASQELQEFYAEINSSYFAGENHLVEWREDLYEELLSGMAFSGLFIQTIYEDGGQNHTERHFDVEDLIVE